MTATTVQSHANKGGGVPATPEHVIFADHGPGNNLAADIAKLAAAGREPIRRPALELPDNGDPRLRPEEKALRNILGALVERAKELANEIREAEPKALYELCTGAKDVADALREISAIYYGDRPGVNVDGTETGL